jgi:hypothetical protein
MKKLVIFGRSGRGDWWGRRAGMEGTSPWYSVYEKQMNVAE